MKKVYLISAGLAVLASAVPAASQTVYFTDRAAFNAAVGSGLNFDGLDDNFNQGNFRATEIRPGYTLSEINGSTNLIYSLSAFNFSGLPVYEGLSAAGYTDNADGSSTGVFNLNQPVNAFGVQYVTSQASALTVGGDVTFAGTTVANTYAFFGVLNRTSTLQRVEFTFANVTDLGVAFDSVTFGTAAVAAPAVPEPATWGMMLMGFGVMGFAMRRRAKVRTNVRFA